MNFWKRFPADYQRKTARLSLAEHGAYTLLLDEMYLTEDGLPEDMPTLYRICRAMSRVERAAVRVVAERFFPVCEDGLRRNPRAAEELGAAGPALQAARANGAKGGRPKGGGGAPENPVGFEDAGQNKNPAETQRVPETETTRARFSQSSELKEKRASADVEPASPARALAHEAEAGKAEQPSTGGMVAEPAGLSPSPAEQACAAMRAVGLIGCQPSDQRLIDLLAQGVTRADLEAVAVEAVHKGAGFAWVLAAVKGRRQDAVAAAAGGPASVPHGAVAVHTVPSATTTEEYVLQQQRQREAERLTEEERRRSEKARQDANARLRQVGIIKPRREAAAC